MTLSSYSVQSHAAQGKEERSGLSGQVVGEEMVGKNLLSWAVLWAKAEMDAQLISIVAWFNFGILQSLVGDFF